MPFEDINSGYSDLMQKLGRVPSSGIPSSLRPASSNVPTGVPIKEVAPGFSPQPADYDQSGYVGNENFPNKTGSIAPTPATKFYKYASGIPGQIAVEPSQPDRVVKYTHVDTPQETAAYRQGLSSADYQIDHITPLWAGGTNNDENKQVLSKEDHFVKTKVEDVARAMYYAGKISLPQALVVAINWKGKDITGIAEKESETDALPPDVAEKYWNKWQQELLRPKASGFFGSIAGAWKELTTPGFRQRGGEYVAQQMPNTPLGELGKHAISSLSLGYIKAPDETYEGSQSFATKMAQVAGSVLGSLPSFAVGEGLITAGARAAEGAGILAKAGSEAAPVISPAIAKLSPRLAKLLSEISVSKILPEISGSAAETRKAVIAAGAAKDATLSEITAAKAAVSAAKGINPIVARVIKNSVNFAALGQVSAIPENTSRVSTLLTSLGSGAVYGAVPTGLKGTFGSMVAAMGLAAANGSNIKDSMANALVIGILHASGNLHGGELALEKSVNEHATKTWMRLGLHDLQYTMDGVPFTTPEDMANNAKKDYAKLLREAGIYDDETAQDPVKQAHMNQLLKEYVLFGRHLATNSLPPEEREVAKMQDITSTVDKMESIPEEQYHSEPLRAKETFTKMGKATGGQTLPPETINNLPEGAEYLATEDHEFVPVGARTNNNVAFNTERLATKENVVDNPIRVVGIWNGKGLEIWAEDPQDKRAYSLGMAPRNFEEILQQNNIHRHFNAPETSTDAHSENFAQLMKHAGITAVPLELVPTPEIKNGELVPGTHTNLAKDGVPFSRVKLKPEGVARGFEMSKMPVEPPPYEPIPPSEESRAYQVLGMKAQGLMTDTARNLERALRAQDTVAIQKVYSMLGLTISPEEAKKILSVGGKLKVGDILLRMISEVQHHRATPETEALLHHFNLQSEEIKDAIWNYKLIDDSFQRRPKLPKAKFVKPVPSAWERPGTIEGDPTAPIGSTVRSAIEAAKKPRPEMKKASAAKPYEGVQLGMEKLPDGKWAQEQNMKTKSAWVDLVNQGHKVRWILDEEPKSRAKDYSDFAKEVEIDGVRMDKYKGFDLRDSLLGKPGAKALETAPKAEEPAKTEPVQETVSKAVAAKDKWAGAKKAEVKPVEVAAKPKKTFKQLLAEKRQAEAPTPVGIDLSKIKPKKFKLSVKNILEPETVTLPSDAPVEVQKRLVVLNNELDRINKNKPTSDDEEFTRKMRDWVPKYKSVISEIQSLADRYPQKTTTRLKKLLSLPKPGPSYAPTTLGGVVRDLEAPKKGATEEERVSEAEKLASEAPAIDEAEREGEQKEGVYLSSNPDELVIPTKDDLDTMSLEDLSTTYKAASEAARAPVTTMADRLALLKEEIHNKFVRDISKNPDLLDTYAKIVKEPGMSLEEAKKALEKPIYGKYTGISSSISKKATRQGIRGELEKNLTSSKSTGDKTFSYVLHEILSKAKDAKTGKVLIDDPSITRILSSEKFASQMFGETGKPESGEDLQTILKLAEIDPNNPDVRKAKERLYELARSKDVEEEPYTPSTAKSTELPGIKSPRKYEFVEGVTELDKLRPKQLMKELAYKFQDMADNTPGLDPRLKEYYTRIADKYSKITDAEAGAEFGSLLGMELIKRVNKATYSKYSSPGATQYISGVDKTKMNKTISDIVTKAKSKPRELLKPISLTTLPDSGTIKPSNSPKGNMKIISGGQTGADLGGLKAAKELGLETGGWAPRGYRAEPGATHDLKSFGLKEHESSNYPDRTRQNVEDADGTVIFAGKPDSPGTRLTLSIVKGSKKPYLLNPTVEELKAWMKEKGINTLNVAGNRESVSPGIEKKASDTIKGALK